MGSPAASEDTLGASQPRLEILEPRVLLSADGLVLELAAQQVAAVGVAEQHVDLVQVATPAAVNAQGVPYDQDFTDGLPTVDQGWEYYSSNQGRIQVLSNRLWMDDSGGGDPYSLNEAILHLNLTGKRGVQLMLNHTSLSDDVHSLPAGFTGHYNGDGIALSVDGIHWVTITPLTESFEDRPFALDGLLDQARTAAGSTDVSDVRIKFQQYDNYPAPDDGRQFDSIRVTAGATPQTTPYIQDFPVLPGAAQGWEYYSTGQGRIQATSEGRLRMDDFGGGDPYSLNEAILHVNLEGHHDIQLVLDHTNLADDNTPLPASFAGHYNGDGIALSLDGIHWVTVANLTDSFTGGIFTLDGPHGILWQAQNAADDGDMTDVRIKFQQYDNYPAPDDGREFDNIRILVGVAAQAIPYAQDFSAALPTGAQGWEYYSTGQGRIQVAGGRLRMDDFGPGDPYSLNEAILHVDLNNKSNIQLILDHYSLSDDNTALPARFEGHYNGDGIAVSTDGQRWVTVASLTSSFAGGVFNLDAILREAVAYSSHEDLSDVRIKFQQYDNYPAPDDGREFDNIGITSTVAPQAVPYSQDFSAGLPTAAQGWEYSSSLEGHIQIVNGRLRMDDSASGEPTGYALNHAILHVNLTGKTGVQLSLDQYVLCPPNTYNLRGAISLSTNGRDWVTVLNMPDYLTESFTGQVFYLDSFLAKAKTAAGSDDISDVRIKFEHLDYNEDDVEIAREFDNLRITSGPQGVLAPQTVPCTQDFSTDLPTAPQGWEYYSANQGRIQVVGGRLRMDDSGAGDPFSHNEAVLHVNLTDKSDIQLRLDHTNLSDENDPVPTLLPTQEFRDHMRGDGIALSVDGLHWLPVTNLTSSFTGGVFHLDAVLAQAKAAAGSADVSDVRIKFQQYDNYPAPDDGREFDNIQVTCGAVVQSVPYAQDFTAGLPTGDQGWTYYTTNDGRFQVVDGRLRMDNSMPDDFRKRATEAVLHVNLAGKSDVRLSLDHYNVSDTVNDVLPPSSFTGHTLLNLIALSVDGLHWVTVTPLRESFTGQTFALDAMLDQAKLDAGSDDLSDVRILLTRFNTTTGANAIREFDNIRITAA